MKSIYGLLVFLIISACETKPFLDHELEYEKNSDGCTGFKEGIKMISNINGERYEFQECLDATFDGKNLTVVRRGDSVIVSFARSKTQKDRALFSITLDIDSYPRYNFMTIDDQTFAVIPAN